MRIVRRIHQRLSSGSRALTVSIGMVLVVIVSLFDWLTGPELDFALFYLVPVCFVTWFAGQRLGYATSIISAAAWLVVDRLTGAKAASPLLVQWNLLMRLTFFAGSVLLLSGWKNIERTLSEMVEQRTHALRKLAAQLSAAEDAERRRLAYDIHDALSQSLSLVKMNLDTAQLESVDHPELQRRLLDCAAMVEQVIRQTKTLMFDLHPSMLDDLGLVPTLQWYAREFQQRTNAELVVSEQGTRRVLSTQLTNYLFRAVKELLNNAARHGRAGEIIVVVHWEPSAVRLVVDDDGSGFDVAAERSSSRRGLGLAGIEERVSSMGGRLIVESKPSEGSRAIIEVPLSSDAEVQRDALASTAG